MRMRRSPDVVIEDGEWEDSGVEPGAPTNGLYTSVLVKQKDKWVIVCDRSMVPFGKKK